MLLTWVGYHLKAIVSAVFVKVGIFGGFWWWRRHCLSSLRCASVSLTGREQRRKAGSRERVGGGTGGGDAAEEISSGCAVGTMRVPQSPVHPSSYSSERNAYLQTWRLCWRICPPSASVCVGVCGTGVSCGPKMRSLTDRSSWWPRLSQFVPPLADLKPSPQVDGQRGLLFSNIRHCH